jgi:formylglycine-generating enzyme required for sulfatase activity
MNRVVLFLFLCGALCAHLYANLPPVLNSVTAAQRTDGSKIVDIYYTVQDAENDSLSVTLNVSGDNGATWAIVPTPANLSGDLGNGVIPGAGKHIVWNAGAESVVFDAATYRFKISVDDHQLPDQWVYVQGGTFIMGSTTGYTDEQPVHQVTLSDFAICDHEVTQAEWQAVTGSNPSSFSGFPNRPVEMVSWYDCIRFCNLKSIADNLTPCYSINGSTNPADWGTVPTTDNATWNAAFCNWNANGYRLPTEAEFEFAARGGVQTNGYTYSGSNTIGDVAWYNGNSDNHTWDVMQKASNELGLYDMSGNVWEKTWDWWGSYLSSQQVNPVGTAVNSVRVFRGGCWFSGEDAARTTCRGSTPDYPANRTGLRLCRSMTPRNTMTSDFALVPGGTFQMGAVGVAEPVHTVTVSTFAMCIHEVTQAEYQTVVGSNPSYFSGYPSRPVEQVSWYDAIRYCNLRSIAEGLTPCYTIGGSTNPTTWGAVPTADDATWNAAFCNWTANGYRLPTEAEWEFAARGGNLSQGYTYSGSNTVGDVAWHLDNSDSHTQDVMTKIANELGLFDMSGNVWEWNWDWFTTYISTPLNNPTGPSSGSSHTERGGGWYGLAYHCHVVNRDHDTPDYRNRGSGFRVVRSGF